MTTSASPTQPVGAPSSGLNQATVFLPNIILDESNYSAWLYSQENFLGRLNLLGYIDGSIPCPPQFISSIDGFTSTPNVDFVVWKTQDRNIMNMIGQTLSSVAMKSAVGSKSSKELWENLRMKFATRTRQNILQLKTNL